MDDLLKQFGIVPNDYSLYEKAFIHTSYAYEHNLPDSYEKLEFLGDAVVDAVISDYLYNCKKYKEGEMTKIRASYVCENALYEFALDLNFNNLIKVGKGEEQTGGTYKKAILADVVEAFIGATYIDQGYEKAKDVMLKIAVPYIENDNILLFSDYKSALQEVVQNIQKSLYYELIEETGPAHNRKFKMAVKIDDIVYGIGVGHSKKDAEQNAAQEALKLLVKKDN